MVTDGQFYEVYIPYLYVASQPFYKYLHSASEHTKVNSTLSLQYQKQALTQNRHIAIGIIPVFLPSPFLIMEHPGQEAHAMRDTAAHVNATNIDDLSLSFVQSIIVDDQASKDPHAEVSSGLFSKLPNELFDLILDSITDPIDKLCLALTCKSMWVDLKPVKKIPLSQEYESEDHKVSTLGCRLVRHVDYICCADSNVYRCGWSNNYTGELSVQWVEGHSGGWAGTSLTYHPHYQRSKERDCFVNKKDLLKLAALQEYGWVRTLNTLVLSLITNRNIDSLSMVFVL